MDVTTVLTGLGVVIGVAGCNIALISWLRADMKAFEAEVRGWREEIQKESKGFRGRLCNIESRYHQKDRRSNED